MFKIIIQNGTRELVISFLDSETTIKMWVQIKCCIEQPDLYPLINYEDKFESYIFTSNYLKNSLIIMPKQSK